MYIVGRQGRHVRSVSGGNCAEANCCASMAPAAINLHSVKRNFLLITHELAGPNYGSVWGGGHIETLGPLAFDPVT